MNPDFWNDPDKARQTQIAIGRLQDPIEGWQGCPAQGEYIL